MSSSYRIVRGVEPPGLPPKPPPYPIGDGPRYQMDGLFDFIGDVISKPFEWAGDIAGWAVEKAVEVTGEVWQLLPDEVRDLAMQFGPIAASVFLPGFGGSAANAALAILEGDRRADEAKDALKKAQAAGQLPPNFDPDNGSHLAAMVQATNPMNPTRQTGGGFSLGGLAPILTAAAVAGGGYLVLKYAGGSRSFGRRGFRRRR